ncbi:MAG: internal scaffolding protein [Microvirus sp.]|nr:MAG: internal scaffolding protein [Microvirus sp.]
MSKIPFFRTPYNYDTMQASDDSAIHFPEPTLCVQSQADDTDINTIVRRFGLTGELPQGIRQPTYGDFSDLGSYQDALNAIQSANESFYSMPADIRTRFKNNPELFVEFCSDEANRAEAEKFGLVMPKAEVLTEVIKPVVKQDDQ